MRAGNRVEGKGAWQPIPFTMVDMSRRLFLRLGMILASLGLVTASIALRAQNDNSHGRKYKAPPPSAHIEVTVLKDFNGKPIQDAHVIFHPIEGDKDKGSLELKTNEDGKIVIDVIPIGDTVRLQIIANGYQTYGHDYKIDKPELSMEIRMKRPGAQYSIYNDTGSSGSGESKSGGSAGSGNGSGSGSDKPSSSSPNAAPPASGSQSSEPANKPQLN